jgi:rhodanese-related sulfurtransferase
MQQLFEFMGNHLVLVALLVAVSLMLIWNLYGGTITGVKLLTPQELTQLINRDGAVLLDVRSSGDFSKGHILGSRNVPDADIPARREDLQKHRQQPVIVCCEQGNVSERVVRTLKAYGLEQVYSLKGGLGSWRAANLPLTKE